MHKHLEFYFYTISL